MEAQQQYYQQYQPTSHQDSASAAQQSYDASQMQAYYAAYHQNYAQQAQQQQDYSSYYYPDYSGSYQNQADPTSGNAIVVNTQPSDGPNQYYAQNSGAQSGYMQTGHRGGRSFRGGGRGGRRGRGRGRGRGRFIQPGRGPSAPDSGAATSSEQGSVQAVSAAPQRRLAWCEICRVDCNSLEILEQHKNGKKHKKNLKVFEELQNLSKNMTGTQNPQSEATDSAPAIEPSVENQPSNVASEAVNLENKAETADEKAETTDGQPFRTGRGGAKRRGRGGGRGGKRMRAYPVEPPKPKQVVPLYCDLCSVKCESPIVFQTHLAGKKHLANIKRFQGHKEAFGEAVQALYPTIPNLPLTSFLSQASQGPQDAQALAVQLLNQQSGVQDTQAAQLALAQLLTQHGINNAQTLLAQLVPYLLAQVQATVAAPLVGSVPGLAPNLPIPGTQVPPGVENQNAAPADMNTEQKTAVTNTQPEGDAGVSDKHADGAMEPEKEDEEFEDVGDEEDYNDEDEPEEEAVGVSEPENQDA